MIRFKTTIIFLLVLTSSVYSTSWDDIDANLTKNECKILKEEIKYRTFSLAEHYNDRTAKKALANIAHSIQFLDEYSRYGCLILDSDREFHNQEVIYWETQKYKVKKKLGEKPERPTWSADEAIKIEQQKEAQKIAQQKEAEKIEQQKIEQQKEAQKIEQQKIKQQKEAQKIEQKRQARVNEMSRFSKDTSPSDGAYGAQMIKRLYGSEFETYSQTQKKFIKNNLETIHRITQRTLTLNGYPDIAVRKGQQGINIVSFYLHPKGKISELRLKEDIGYQALDQNTLDVIRIAYKDYPLPIKKTRIIFYVQYSLY